MLATPWVCRNCLLRLAKPLIRRQIRLQSTGEHRASLFALSEPSTDVAQAATSEAIPPALLTRARTVASEHKELTKRLADGFDTRAAKKVGEYSPIVNALQEWDKANEVGTLQDSGQERLGS